MQLPERSSVLPRSLSYRVRWLGAAISVALIGGALSILYHILHGIDINRVMTAVADTPWRILLLAALCVGASYLTLTFYDYFALRTVGRRDVPYRAAVFASFVAQTIGHGLGAPILTGNVVRLRIYSAWGIGLAEIAKMAFIAGVTFWLGNIVVLSIALASAPNAAGAVTHAPAWVNQAIGTAGLLAVACYVAWLVPRRRRVGYASWQMALPGWRSTFVQIGIGLLDFAAGSLAFWVLMPATPATDFVVIGVVFVAATLLGLVSHAPGSIGVFDAAVLVALPQFEKEGLLAALLLFRLLYFVIPFCLAVLMFLGREVWLARRRQRASQYVAPDIRAIEHLRGAQ